MTKFKISLHCGQVNTFLVDEFENRDQAFEEYYSIVNSKFISGDLMRIGDVLINPKQITFVVVEELIEKAEEPTAGATIEV